MHRQSAPLFVPLRFLGALSILLASAALFPVQAQTPVATVTLRNDYRPGGYTGTEDTWIWEAYKTYSKGGHEDFNVGTWLGPSKERGLIRFNLSSLKGRFTHIIAARLKLTVKRMDVYQGGPWTGQAFNLYRVSDANRSWSAGTSTDLPQEGAACWSYKAFSSVIDLTTGKPGGTDWAGSAGCGTPDIDFVTTPISTVNLSSTVTPGTVVTWNLTNLNDLEDWVARPSDNAGYRMTAPGLEALGKGQAAAFHSSEAADFAVRPALELDLEDYKAPPGSPITYTLRNPGHVSLNLYDAAGHVVRELLHAEREAAGKHTLTWDRMDAGGAPVPAGNYSWKLLETPDALTAHYLMTIGNSAKPDWDPNTGNDEGIRGVAADSTGVYFSGVVSEGAHLVYKNDYKGNRLWTHHDWVETWQGAVSLAVDANILYMMQHNGKIARFNANDGKYLGAWDTAYTPADHDDKNPPLRYDLAASHGKMIVSFPGHDAVRWVSEADGSTLSEVHIPHPQGIALNSVGNAYIISGKSVVRLSPGASAPTALITTGLVLPWRISVDPTTGDLLIFDAGANNQVERFGADGSFKAAYGRRGGRSQGRYNGSDFQEVMGIAAGTEGDFWITEPYSMPRRSAHYAAEGKLIAEFYGSQIYGVHCSPDPADSSLVWMNAGNGGALQWKVDYAHKLWTLKATYACTDISFPTGDVIKGPALSRGYGFAEDYPHIRHHAGKTYLCWENRPQVELVDESAGRLRPMVASGNVKDLPAALKPADPTQRMYLWTDLNGDGQPTPNEFSFTPISLTNDSWNGGNGYITSNFTYYLNLYPGIHPAWPTTAPGRLHPRGWTPGGAPLYNWLDMNYQYADPLPTSFKYTAPYSTWVDESTGAMYGAYNLLINYDIGGPGGGNGFWGHRAGDTKLVKWDRTGKLQWAVGRQSRTGGADQGEMRYAWRIAGGVHGCIVVSDVENGLEHVWDSDGLWVSRLLDQRAQDGLPGEVYSEGNEDFGTEVFQDARSGNTYFFVPGSGSGDRVYQITGWDHWTRMSGRVGPV